MATSTISALTAASGNDPVNDYLAIDVASVATTQKINRNTLLSLASAPVGLTDTQTLTNKTLTSPTISGPTLSGTLTGTYTIGGTPTFPSSVTTLTGTQTLTNKTLTSPTINSPTITNATITADTVAGFTTSNTGTIYGMSVTTGVLASAAIAGAVNSAALASGIQVANVSKNPYKFSVYRGSNQTISSGTWTKVQLDTKNFDTGSNFDNSTNYQFTAPISGFYQLQCLVSVTATDGGLNAIGINIGSFGTFPTYQANMLAGSANSPSMTISILVSMTASQTAQVYVYSSSTAINGTQQYSNFSGFLVSAT